MAALTERPVLVTGAFGDVGRYVLDRLPPTEAHVVATDLRTPDTERAAAHWQAAAPQGCSRDVVWADLRDRDAVLRLVAANDPRAVVHLAGVIPPATYHDVTLARAVNVGAVEHLADAIAAQQRPARLVLASSMATFGPRNPHTAAGVATAETATRPCEVYGAHKVEAERIVRERVADQVVLRLALVVFPDYSVQTDLEAMYLEALLPTDGRVHVVDGRDAATALVRAVDADCSGAVLLVGGDDTCRMRQHELSRDMTRAVGMPGVLPQGLPGDPQDDRAWFCVDWMDTREAQELLSYQEHTWQDTLRDVSLHVGWRRRVMPLAVPLARAWMSLTPPRRGRRGPYSRMWDEVAERWGRDALCEADAGVPGEPQA
jgi:nucleoside-diphosphate-sugar epimerase